AGLRGVLAGALGIGFLCPPRTRPLPLLPGRWSAPEDQQRVEAMLLDSINGARALCGGGAPLAAAAEMFAPVEDVLTTFPELDHYGARAGGTYWGPIDASFGGARPAWPDADGPRIFAFVESTSGCFDKLIA